MSDYPDPNPNDVFPDYDEDLPTCPYCGEKYAIEYIGEGYDEDVHIGSSYNCLECGHHFNDLDVHIW